MRTHYLVAAVLVLGSVLHAQTTTPAASPQSSSGAIGPSAVWAVTLDFMKAAQATCSKATQPPSFEECYIDQMAKAGAPPDAVKFTRDLYQANQQVGIMGRFHPFGPIAMVWVVYPLRANNNDGILFVNSKPNFLDVDDMKRLDKAPMLVNPVFLDWKKENPNLDVWPGDRSGSAIFVEYAKSYAGTNTGETQFLLSYPLIDGCHACARHGVANFWWSFDAQGNFLGTKFVSVSPVPPPLKRSRPKPPLGTTPSTTGAPEAAPSQPSVGTPDPATPPPATSQPAQPK